MKSNEVKFAPVEQDFFPLPEFGPYKYTEEQLFHAQDELAFKLAIDLQEKRVGLLPMFESHPIQARDESYHCASLGKFEGLVEQVCKFKAVSEKANPASSFILAVCSFVHCAVASCCRTGCGWSCCCGWSCSRFICANRSSSAIIFSASLWRSLAI